MQNDVIEGYKLSAQQRRLWSLQQANSTYYAYTAILIEGLLEPEKLQKALRHLVRRHEILHARFPLLTGLRMPVQAVTASTEFLWRELDLHHISDILPTRERVHELLQEELRQPFDYAQGPLLRATLINLAERENLLLLSTPAMCADAWTMELLARDLCRYYWQSGTEEITDEPLQYAQFSSWQDELLESAEAEAEKNHWQNPSFVESLNISLPFEKPVTLDVPVILQSSSFPIDPALAHRIKAKANAQAITPSTFLLAAWAVLLWRLTEKSELTIGVACDGRDYQELRETFGPVAKLLPQLCRLEPGLAFRALLRDIHEGACEVRDRHEYFSWEQITGTDDSQAGQIFCPFSFDYRERAPQQQAHGLTFSILADGALIDKFKIQLACVHTGDNLVTEFSYDAARFSTAAVINLASQYQTLLESAVTDVEREIDRLNLLSRDECRRVLIEFNPPEDSAIADACIHHLIEEQARRTPDAVAVLSQEGWLTYAQLNARANQLAHHLTASGVGVDSIVAVCLNRSADFLIAMFAVLKAGAAYLPLDPAYPGDRTAFMLTDSGAQFILTHRRLASSLPPHPAPIFCLDADWHSITTLPAFDSGRALSPLNLAYLLYTSGSTGQPKGVLVAHGNLVHSTQARLKYYKVPPACFLLASPFPFDSSVAGIFWTLTTGGALLLPMDDFQQDLACFIRLIADQRVSHLLCLPSLFDLILRQAALNQLRTLSTLILAGEPCQPQLVQTIRRQLPDTAIYNEYGPTETTVWASVFDCCAFETGAVVPIGRPISKTRIHLIDERLEPVAIGIPGHLHIGGGGVARGYLNRGDVTAKRFIPDPFSATPGARLYRTGDLARYLPDGCIQFWGRIDHQVKIRGFRVELGEIEAALNKHPAIKQAAVIAREDKPGNQQLVAYVAANGVPGASQMRAFLKTILPDFMIPAAFVVLESLPVTPNGKLDRKRLPLPDQARPELERAYLAPRTIIEQALAEVWSAILGVERVGIHDNFFELGGDSIRSIQVLTRAQERGIKFSLHQLNQSPTIHDLALQAIVEDRPTVAHPLYWPFSLISEDDRSRLPGDVEDAYPLAMLQTGMLFHSEYDRDSAIYHDIASFHLQAPADATALTRAAERLAANHAVLRTSFDLTGFSEPLQLVHRTAAIPCHVDDLGHLSSAEQEAAIEAWLEAEKNRKFDWQKTPLLRFHIHLRGAGSFQLSYTCHHAILDGWSAASMMAELFQIYFRLLGREAMPPAPPRPTCFAEFIALERETAHSAEAQRYWSDKLDGCAAANLPRWPFSGPPPDPKQGGAIELDLPPELPDNLKQLASALEVPLKSVLLATHMYVISVVSGQADVMTGVVSHGRLEESGSERALGLFLNTMPFRLKLSGGTWVDLVKQTAQAEQEMFAFRRFPMARLQRARGGQPLFETTFNFVHFHVYQGVLQFEDVQAIGSKFFQRSNLPLAVTFQLMPATGSMQVRIQYDPAVITIEQAEALRDHYLHTLNSMASQYSARHEQLTLLTEHERVQILEEWNRTKAGYPDDCCLHDLFEQQAGQAPERIAMVCAEQQITFGQLNERANQLAHYLLSLGLGSEDHVALYFSRSSDMVVALLATLKAGAAYLPLDLAQPADRLEVMLREARPRLILTHRELSHRLPRQAVPVLSLDRDSSLISQHSPQDPGITVDPQQAAYLLFTSGSTGRPKAVLVEHRQVTNYLYSIAERLDLNSCASYALVSTFAADLGNTMIFPALAFGGCLHVISAERASDPMALAAYFEQYPVDCLKIVPSYLGAILSLPEPERLLPRHRLVLGGEALRWELVDRIRELSPTCRIFNHYGPTETTVGVIAHEIKGDSESARLAGVPLGRPLGNIEIYLLDGRLRPVPLCTPGEIYIGGAGVTRHYLDQPEQTAERFLPDPFSGRPGARFYRTGDVGRFLPDGKVEFLGRIDHQVKVRGYRIELGEIEAALLEYSEVKEAVVEAHAETPGEMQLIGYVALSETNRLSAYELRRRLLRKLPEYMAPKRFVLLESLPRTANGKVDRQALAALDTERLESPHEHVPPRTALEEALAQIWQQSLGLRQVGVHDDFFELGGDSILSLQIAIKANQAGLRLTPEMIFKHPTIAELAAMVSAVTEATAEQHVITGPVLLTPIQAAFFEKVVTDLHHWNQAILLEARQLLDPALLEQAVYQLLRQHDALRLRFELRETGWHQFIAEPEEQTPFAWFDLSSLSEAEQRSVIETRAAETQASLNLSRGPILRAVWFERGNQERGRLLIVIHHLAVDGVSWRILLDDLQTAYRQLSRHTPVQFPPKTTSYQQWAERLRAETRSAALLEELAYWTSEERRQVTSLPVDYSTNGGANTVSSAREVSVSLDARETRALLQDLPKAYRTQINDALLTALTQALSDWTRRRALLVELEGHGREGIFKDLDITRSVGWFTAAYPVLLELDRHDGPSEALKQIKEQLHSLPNRGIGYGLLRYLSTDPSIIARLRAMPQPEISFNYLGQFDRTFDEESLFGIAPESKGPERSLRGLRNRLLEVNSGIIGGEFRAIWTYSENLHSRETIERLAHSFITALRSLITHCQGESAGIYTPSDFPLANLNQKQLDRIRARLGRSNSGKAEEDRRAKSEMLSSSSQTTP